MDLSYLSFLSDTLLYAFMLFLEFACNFAIDLLFLFMEILPNFDIFNYVDLDLAKSIFEKLAFANLFLPVYETFTLTIFFMNCVIIFAIVKFFIKLIPFVG